MAALLPSSTPEGVHRRLNILTGKHVLVSPHRSKRPWNVESNKKVQLPAHDPACYLCPGNQRVGGDKNPEYTKQYIFGNDFPALVAPPEAGASAASTDPNAPQEVYGCCKVLCYHPRHDITMAGMSESELGGVIEAWKEVYTQTSGQLQAMEPAEGPSESHVMIFENRGAAMGASAPHPHGQVWGTSFIPDEVETEYELFARHRSRSTENQHLLVQYAQEELRNGSRVVAEDAAGWLAVVPFWATWPFEVLVLPTNAQIPSLVDLTAPQAEGLARILKQVLGMYDALFDCPFPYSMGLHQAPSAHGPKHDAQLHIHFYPPLLRSATVRKFMVGFELLAEAQRDLTPEQAAARLRDARVAEVPKTNGVH